MKAVLMLAVVAMVSHSAFARDRVKPKTPCEVSAVGAARAFLERQVPESFDLMNLRSLGNSIEVTFENDEETDVILAQVAPGRAPGVCRVIGLQTRN